MLTLKGPLLASKQSLEKQGAQICVWFGKPSACTDITLDRGLIDYVQDTHPPEKSTPDKKVKQFVALQDTEVVCKFSGRTEKQEALAEFVSVNL